MFIQCFNQALKSLEMRFTWNNHHNPNVEAKLCMRKKQYCFAQVKEGDSNEVGFSQARGIIKFKHMKKKPWPQ